MGKESLITVSKPNFLNSLTAMQNHFPAIDFTGDEALGLNNLSDDLSLLGDLRNDILEAPGIINYQTSGKKYIREMFEFKTIGEDEELISLISGLNNSDGTSCENPGITRLDLAEAIEIAEQIKGIKLHNTPSDFIEDMDKFKEILREEEIPECSESESRDGLSIFDI